MPAIDPAWIALIGTLCGGIGLKVAEHWLGKGKVKVDDAARIRDELRLEITAQREEIKELEQQVQKWQADYYDLRDKHIKLQTELMIALQKIKDEADEAEEQAKRIAHEPPPTPTLD